MSYFNAKPTLQSSDHDLVSSLRTLKDFDDVAALLEITSKHLHYILFKKKIASYYKSFNIPKKNGGVREIWAPQHSLKALQDKLNKIFSLAYKPNITSHGFVKERGIVTNANVHLRKRHVLNFDIEDFFHSINFGRVRGILKSFFGMSSDAATVIANICCFNNVLPQGAPTSPIISNMVCFNLDKEMRNVAKQFNCDYTRYADDITFSTTRHSFPRAIGYFDEEQTVHLGAIIQKVLYNNGFSVNNSKTRLNNCDQNLSVTGITVNKITNVERNYVKKVRAILRCLETNPLPEAQKLFESRYHSNSEMKKNAPIMHVVKGMITHIGYVKGKQDPVYEKLARRYNRLAGRDALKVGEAFLNYWSQNVFVIEVGYMEEDSKVFSSQKQGTGFFMKDVGFVTNWHVVRDHIDMPDLFIIKVHRSRYCKKHFNASIRIYDEERDIAILDIDGVSSTGFNYDVINHDGQSIKVIGYPDYGHQDSLYVEPGVITQYRSQYMPNAYNRQTGELGLYQERIVSSARIVYGNSGGPVINSKGQVIGIATKGFNSVSRNEKDDDSSAASHVVKIGDLFDMLRDKEKGQPIPSSVEATK
ncbi:reverse transcriptase domain-containing protein [Paenibacillus thiaminolyticus]|uniref:reverse transcriptase domain-containing protein n=1 Tax=Paenibacillus thiaminolyticus TaxID=49283 RepID=UPI00254352A0|nr:reverse transcriptase domain-containing protein [Paenibacillus thiaminolyticus]WII38407.1 reverse transcriptase domain-containing protein [Paenibacillus thiaminolyticus]